MWPPTWRFLVLIVLLACGAGAAWSSWNASHQIVQLDRSQRDLSDRVDQLLATLEGVTTGQQISVGASADPTRARVADLIGQIGTDIDRLRPHVRSLEAGRTLQAVTGSIATLHDVERRALELLSFGQDLMASDLLLSEGRSAGAAIASGLHTLRAAENDQYAIARAEALDLSWTILGGLAIVWVVGLGLLARTPALVASHQSPAAAAPPSQSVAAIADMIHQPTPASTSNIQAAADVCTAIGRLTSADDLPRLLQQSATVLDAAGMVVWMAAGEELFAAAAYGYPPQVIQKLGPINRSAVNATAAAWRTGTLQAVTGEYAERSALAAPMLGPDRCIGVLAVEVGAGRDADDTIRAITMMFAAQLAAALAGWPAASAAAPVDVPPLDRAVEA